MILNELLELAKNFGLGAVGCFIGGTAIVKAGQKLSRADFYRHKDDVVRQNLENERRFAAGSVKFAELDMATKCLPEMQSDIKEILQSVASIRATIERG